jgi:hypothetical protein
MHKLFIYCLKRISSIIKESESSRRNQRHFFIKGKIISLQINSWRVDASLLLLHYSNYTILISKDQWRLATGLAAAPVAAAAAPAAAAAVTVAVATVVVVAVVVVVILVLAAV